ncbi:uncharacterized protein LOC130997278 [Salvia miltiorrhiza]|uniref:uncharacterized protein LOC130997278 n=1 Tax=Salvia miltiorrhiza TaxID=226208 RepID=UPI0025AB872E|nr:uncharacterized protein LOC130997278 [Salvia miltiorrhiza]
MAITKGSNTGNRTKKDKGKNIVDGSAIRDGSIASKKGTPKSKAKGKGVNDANDFVEGSPRVTRGSVKGKEKVATYRKGKEANLGDARLNEVRTKYRNDPALLAFKRSILGGEILKRKLGETSGKDAAGSLVVHDVGVVSPVAPAKRKRIDKRKLAVGNYTKLQVKSYDDYPSLYIRSTPCVLLKAVKEMNDVQKEAVKSLGFGSVLDLTIQEMPSKLDYWVLDCFHARRSEIVLPSGKTIEVTDEDAYRVLGFPRGDRSLELLDKCETTDLYDVWVSCFPDKNRKTIKISDVKDAMIASVDGGRWFKLHFLVMVTHCLIESTTHGSVVPRVIKSLDDLTVVRDFNWCEYVVDSLVESKGKWEKDTQSMYTGPIMFHAVRWQYPLLFYCFGCKF